MSANKPAMDPLVALAELKARMEEAAGKLDAEKQANAKAETAGGTGIPTIGAALSSGGWQQSFSTASSGEDNPKESEKGNASKSNPSLMSAEAYTQALLQKQLESYTSLLGGVKEAGAHPDPVALQLDTQSTMMTLLYAQNAYVLASAELLRVQTLKEQIGDAIQSEKCNFAMATQCVGASPLGKSTSDERSRTTAVNEEYARFLRHRASTLGQANSPKNRPAAADNRGFFARFWSKKNDAETAGVAGNQGQGTQQKAGSSSASKKDSKKKGKVEDKTKKTKKDSKSSSTGSGEGTGAEPSPPKEEIARDVKAGTPYALMLEQKKAKGETLTAQEEKDLKTIEKLKARNSWWRRYRVPMLLKVMLTMVLLEVKLGWFLLYGLVVGLFLCGYFDSLYSWLRESSVKAPPLSEQLLALSSLEEKRRMDLNKLEERQTKRKKLIEQNQPIPENLKEELDDPPLPRWNLSELMYELRLLRGEQLLQFLRDRKLVAEAAAPATATESGTTSAGGADEDSKNNSTTSSTTILNSSGGDTTTSKTGEQKEQATADTTTTTSGVDQAGAAGTTTTPTQSSATTTATTTSVAKKRKLDLSGPFLLEVPEDRWLTTFLYQLVVCFFGTLYPSWSPSPERIGLYYRLSPSEGVVVLQMPVELAAAALEGGGGGLPGLEAELRAAAADPHGAGNVAAGNDVLNRIAAPQQLEGQGGAEQNAQNAGDEDDVSVSLSEDSEED
ncbi:unnamed protein product [Amoebophrya sp. A25]|nr:unnamed protein product [Amoebophrya sp. A25]|eukprot:GSA25T00024135001.1